MKRHSLYAWTPLALLALHAALIVGCGYHLSGTGAGAGVIPSYVTTIAVLPFENRTERPEIEQRVTEAVTRELTRRSKYKILTDPSRADTVLEGAVTSYRTPPVEFTASGRQSRVEATVMVQATLRDTAQDEVLWSQTGLIFREQFDVPDSGKFFDQESVALDQIAQGAAEVLVTSMLEGF